MKKSLSRRLAALGLATTSLALAAAPAALATPATFSPTGAVVPSETSALTLVAGSTPTPQFTFTCTPAMIYHQNAFAGNSPNGYLQLNVQAICQSGIGQTWTLRIDDSTAGFTADNTGAGYAVTRSLTPSVVLNGARLIASNISQWLPSPAIVPFLNGTGVANPSKIVFNNTQIGIASNSGSGMVGQPITLTGTINLAPSAGGVLTLS